MNECIIATYYTNKKNMAINFDFVSFVFGRLHNVAVFRDFTHSSSTISMWKYKNKNINILPCYWNINFYAIDVSVNRQMTLKLFMALATEHKEPTENRIWWQSVIETDDANNIVGKSIKLNVEENKNAPIHQHNHKNIESIKCIKIKSF